MHIQSVIFTPINLLADESKALELAKMLSDQPEISLEERTKNLSMVKEIFSQRGAETLQNPVQLPNLFRLAMRGGISLEPFDIKIIYNQLIEFAGETRLSAEAIERIALDCKGGKLFNYDFGEGVEVNRVQLASISRVFSLQLRLEGMTPLASYFGWAVKNYVEKRVLPNLEHWPKEALSQAFFFLDADEFPKAIKEHFLTALIEEGCPLQLDPLPSIETAEDLELIKDLVFFYFATPHEKRSALNNPTDPLSLEILRKVRVPLPLIQNNSLEAINALVNGTPKNQLEELIAQISDVKSWIINRAARCCRDKGLPIALLAVRASKNFEMMKMDELLRFPTTYLEAIPKLFDSSVDLDGVLSHFKVWQNMEEGKLTDLKSLEEIAAFHLDVEDSEKVFMLTIINNEEGLPNGFGDMVKNYMKRGELPSLQDETEATLTAACNFLIKHAHSPRIKDHFLSSLVDLIKLEEVKDDTPLGKVLSDLNHNDRELLPAIKDLYYSCSIFEKPYPIQLDLSDLLRRTPDREKRVAILKIRKAIPSGTPADIEAILDLTPKEKWEDLVSELEIDFSSGTEPKYTEVSLRHAVRLLDEVQNKNINLPLSFAALEVFALARGGRFLNVDLRAMERGELLRDLHALNQFSPPELLPILFEADVRGADRILKNYKMCQMDFDAATLKECEPLLRKHSRKLLIMPYLDSSAKVPRDWLIESADFISDRLESEKMQACLFVITQIFPKLLTEEMLTGLVALFKAPREWGFSADRLLSQPLHELPELLRRITKLCNLTDEDVCFDEIVRAFEVERTIYPPDKRDEVSFKVASKYATQFGVIFVHCAEENRRLEILEQADRISSLDPEDWFSNLRKFILLTSQEQTLVMESQDPLAALAPFTPSYRQCKNPYISRFLQLVPPEKCSEEVKKRIAKLVGPVPDNEAEEDKLNEYLSGKDIKLQYCFNFEHIELAFESEATSKVSNLDDLFYFVMCLKEGLTVKQAERIALFFQSNEDSKKAAPRFFIEIPSKMRGEFLRALTDPDNNMETEWKKIEYDFFD